METSVRAAVAFIAGRIISKAQRHCVYDHGHRRYLHYSGPIDANQINLFDIAEGSHIVGSPPSLFHHGRGHPITLNILENRFHGFDRESSAHFFGEVRGEIVWVFDFETKTRYDFTLA